MSKHFRPCAGAIVFNKDGKVFLGSRIETANDSWQFPQGGIEAGEIPAEAACRELYEETGISSVELVYTDIEPTRYEFSAEIKENFRKRGIFNDGQDIYFSLFYFTGNEKDIHLDMPHPEFKRYKWDTLEFAVFNVIDFKKEAYSVAAQRMAPLIKDYIAKLS